MNILELTTWNRLAALDFDAADAVLPFSKRLARENGWSLAFAGRAIEEYRKFCFLAVHAGHPVTPSDEVDQVWHLHLLYSRHYWHSLCRDALEKPLHHGPTQGGAAEDHKFNEWYEATLESYRRFFGEPPRDVWPAAQERFDAHHRFVRIDRRDVVTLDRATLRRGAFAVIAGGGTLAMAALAQTDAAAPSPNGVPWVILISIAAVVGLIALAMRARKQAPGKRKARNASGAAYGGAGIGCGSSSKSPGNGDSSPDGGSAGCGSSGCGGGGGCGGGS